MTNSLSDEAREALPYLASDERTANYKKAPGPVVRPWVHFVAGGIGGMAGAIVTCPFDLVKTRLQSDLYVTKLGVLPGALRKSNNSIITSSSVAKIHIHRWLQHPIETMAILSTVRRQEGFKALFRGLGPNLVGVIPARSINFFTYGTTKDLYSKNLNNGQEAPWIHLLSAATAGWATSTATNPIWLIKTRVQLAKASSDSKSAATSSWRCLKQVLNQEGIRGLYRGLSASYLGSIEGILQWVLYEQMKHLIRQNAIERMQGSPQSAYDKTKEWFQRSGSAGLAKFVASIVTYPHEVVRTRLRQPTVDGKLKYTGLLQTFRLVWHEEGLASMYGGLTPHLMRTVPNSIIMFGTWEIVIHLLS